jgi:hypothetical protein
MRFLSTVSNVGSEWSNEQKAGFASNATTLPIRSPSDELNEPQSDELTLSHSSVLFIHQGMAQVKE